MADTESVNTTPNTSNGADLQNLQSSPPSSSPLSSDPSSALSSDLPSGAPPAADRVAHTDVEELKKQILSQVEYYFSEENLPKDSYLQSKLDADLYVPIDVLAAFPKLKTLSNSDVGLIIEALSSSSKLEMDGSKTKIRLRQPPRLTIIIREVPSSISEAELKTFLGEKEIHPRTLSRISEDHWYATFDSESAAVKSTYSIRNLELNGKNLGACLKHEPIQSVLSSWSNPEPFVPHYGGVFPVYGVNAAGFPEYFVPRFPPNANPHLHSVPNSGSNPSRRDPSRDSRRPRDPSSSSRRSNQHERGGDGGQRRGERGQRRGERGNGSSTMYVVASNPSSSSSSSPSFVPTGGNQVVGQPLTSLSPSSFPVPNGNTTSGHGNPSHRRRGPHDSSDRSRHNFQLSPSSFPPLKHPRGKGGQYSVKELVDNLKNSTISSKPENFVDIAGVTLDSPLSSLVGNFDSSDSLFLHPEEEGNVVAPAVVSTSAPSSKVSYCQIAAQKN